MPLENLLGPVGDLYCFSNTFRMLVLPVLDFTTFFFDLYCHGILRHRSRKREVNFEELDVLFDQLVEGNSCIWQ